MALPFFHLSQMFKPTMSEEDLKEIKGNTSMVQVDNSKVTTRMSKEVKLLRHKTANIGQMNSKLSRRMTDENVNSVSVSFWSLR